MDNFENYQNQFLMIVGDIVKCLLRANVFSIPHQLTHLSLLDVPAS